MTTKKQQERAEAIAALREILKPGDTVYCIIRHVSASGMSRVIDLYTIQDNEHRWISSLAARAMGDRLHQKHQGLVVSGCGMDMCFATVYNLGATIFGRGEQCAALGYATGRNRETGPETDGGYLLKARTI